MAASPRAHVNLNLYLAERAVRWLASAGDSSEWWGSHEALVAAETAIFRLQLAYRCHLADLCAQQQLEMEPASAAEAEERLRMLDESIPEMIELAEREVSSDWLRGLLAYRYAEFSSGGDPAVGMIASTAEPDADWHDAAHLREVIAALTELIDRHRDSQQEY